MRCSVIIILDKCIVYIMSIEPRFAFTHVTQYTLRITRYMRARVKRQYITAGPRHAYGCVTV